jgi:hypothetical protein
LSAAIRGETAAIVISLCTTCKHLKINPLAYLTDILSRVSTRPARLVDELLPHGWQALREAANLAQPVQHD